MLSQIEAALAALKPKGTFATQRACSSTDLLVEVDGVGPLRFPISATTAQVLCAVAKPAPFGRRDQTLHDRSIRDTWEIDKGRIHIDTPRWKRTLDPVLKDLGKKLGLPSNAELIAVLDKLLVYTPGQFFAPHQDSERTDEMVGSLVLELPSKSAGGSVVVHHQGEKLTFRGARRGPKDLSVLAFYADCHHEVTPITSGYRVVLTWQLLQRGPPGPAAPIPTAAVGDLTQQVKAYFSTQSPPRYGKDAELPDRLIYLLDHQYTEKSLAWTRLKNGDRLRVAALRQAAGQLDCECFLALADVHENWSCEEDGYDWRGRHHYRERDFDDEGEGEGEESSELALGELCDTSVELRHWVTSQGSGAPAVAADALSSEICVTRPSIEFDPFQSEHEGYMGNYGNTVDRWYHRAAFVMWPRARTFAIRAKGSPLWAVNELATMAQPAAREAARSLLPFWGRHAPGVESAKFFSMLLEVVNSLDEAELAHGLLGPFGPHRLTAGTLSTFASLVERHGVAWSQRLFAGWSKRPRYDTPSWLPILRPLFAALLKKAPTHGKALASWLLLREVGALEEKILASLKLRAVWLDERAAEHTQTVLALLGGAAELEAGSTRDGLLTLLTTGKTALTILNAAALLEVAPKKAAVETPGLGTIHRYAIELLERTLAIPPRRADDWSIDLPVQCRCELCARLSTFLRDRVAVEHVWPLAEDRRRHVHNAIDGHKLPVTHVTRRGGRPYSLVLTKQKALFVREAQVRARQQTVLARLKSQRPTS